MLDYSNYVNLTSLPQLLDYTTEVTLKLLLSKLFDFSLILNHKYIIQAIDTIIYCIGDQITRYLYFLVPVLGEYLLQDYTSTETGGNHYKDRMRFEVLKLFEKLIKLCGKDFGSSNNTSSLGNYSSNVQDELADMHSTKGYINRNVKEGYLDGGNVGIVLEVLMNGLEHGDCKTKCLEILIELIETSKCFFLFF
jgi:hypothetical protein